MKDWVKKQALHVRSFFIVVVHFITLRTIWLHIGLRCSIAYPAAMFDISFL